MRQARARSPEAQVASLLPAQCTSKARHTIPVGISLFTFQIQKLFFFCKGKGRHEPGPTTRAPEIQLPGSIARDRLDVGFRNSANEGRVVVLTCELSTREDQPVARTRETPTQTWCDDIVKLADVMQML